jgi:hypothetical protein
VTSVFIGVPGRIVPESTGPVLIPRTLTNSSVKPSRSAAVGSWSVDGTTRCSAAAIRPFIAPTSAEGRSRA